MDYTLDLWDELNKFGNNAYYQNRKKYFLWKNGLDTTTTTYSDKTIEEMKKILKVTEAEWRWLERWENSDLYKRLMYIMYQNKFDDDILELYDEVKKQALTGNSTAVKTLLMLQEEIENRLKPKVKVKEKIEEEKLKLKLKV